MVAHERLTEPRVTMELLLAKPRSFSTLPAFLDLKGLFIFFIYEWFNDTPTNTRLNLTVRLFIFNWSKN